MRRSDFCLSCPFIGESTGPCCVTLNGAIYIFIRSGSTWTEQAKVKSSYVRQSLALGRGVSLNANGDTLVGGMTDRIVIFTRSGVTWSEQQIIAGSNTELGDWLWAVAISGDGNTIVCGAYGEVVFFSSLGFCFGYTFQTRTVRELE